MISVSASGNANGCSRRTRVARPSRRQISLEPKRSTSAAISVASRPVGGRAATAAIASAEGRSGRLKSSRSSSSCTALPRSAAVSAPARGEPIPGASEGSGSPSTRSA